MHRSWYPCVFLDIVGSRSVDHQSSRQLAFTRTLHFVLSGSCLREPDWNLRSCGFRVRSHGQTWNKWNKRWTLQMRKEVAVIQFLFQHIRDDSGPWRKWANLSLWCMSVLGTGKKRMWLAAGLEANKRIFASKRISLPLEPGLYNNKKAFMYGNGDLGRNKMYAIHSIWRISII